VSEALPTSEPDPAAPPVFAERLTAPVVREALVLGVAPLALAGVAGALGATGVGYGLLGLAFFVAFFFRNPRREIPGDERTVVAPADGRVLDVSEVEGPDGSKALRIGIFLSVFDVHVNRCPVAGRVLSIERGGSRYRAAFDRRAEADNVRCTLMLETALGERVAVSQITGLIARRIVCHPQVGEWVARGARYGMIRFGSRTDVVLPRGSEARVARGDRVRGGSSVVARLPEAAAGGGRT
jgi:phosphatidylserine decarboxylase